LSNAKTRDLVQNVLTEMGYPGAIYDEELKCFRLGNADVEVRINPLADEMETVSIYVIPINKIYEMTNRRINVPTDVGNVVVADGGTRAYLQFAMPTADFTAEKTNGIINYLVANVEGILDFVSDPRHIVK